MAIMTPSRLVLVAVPAVLIGGFVWYEVSGRGQVVTAGEATVLVSERVSYGMDARLGGPLEVLGGCLGASGVVVVWPHGTDVVDEDPLTIDIPGMRRYAVGDQVAIGGGGGREEGELPPEGPVEVAGVSVPESCARFGVFLSHAD